VVVCGGGAADARDGASSGTMIALLFVWDNITLNSVPVAHLKEFPACVGSGCQGCVLETYFNMPDTVICSPVLTKYNN
jgi:hypothetical protein